MQAETLNKSRPWLAQRYPKLTLLLWAAALTLCVAGLTRLQFSSDHRAFFDADNPELQALEKLENTFSKAETVFFAIAAHEGGLFTAEKLPAVRRLTELAEQMPWVQRVSSLDNFQKIMAVGDDLEVLPLLPETLPTSASGLAALKTAVLAESRIQGLLINADASVTGVSARLAMPEGDPANNIPTAHAAAKAAKQTLESEYPGISVKITGLIPLNAAFREAMILDGARLYPLAFLLSFLLLALIFRSALAATATTTIVGFAVVISMGAVGWLHPQLTTLSASAAIMILTLAVADCVHVQTSFRQRLEAGSPAALALSESLHLNFRPIALTSITTAIGFASLNFSIAPPFRLLGNTVVGGVLIAWLLTLTALPAMYTLFGHRVAKPSRAPATSTPGSKAIRWLSHFATRRPALMVMVLLALASALLAGLPRHQFGDDYVRYFGPELDFRRDTEFVNANLTGQQLIEYGIDAGDYEAITHPEFLQHLDAFSNWLALQPEVRKVLAIPGVFKELNRAMHGGDEQWYKLPTRRDEAAQFLFFYELGLPLGKDTQDEIDIHKRSTRVAVILDTIDAGRLLQFEERAWQWMQKNWPATLHQRGGGTSILFSKVSKRNFIAMFSGTALVLVLIGVLMIVSLRSLKIGLISLIPNILPSLAAFGLWGWTVGRLDMATAVVASMSLGIIIDDTVHLLNRYLIYRREHGLNATMAIRAAIETVGPALLTTSAALLVGFGVISQSQFALNGTMALLTMSIVIAALVTDLLLLPALLRYLDKD